ncbi:TonB-dependent receptor [uncultured Massilia sp.]|uniref:TonB-dependent receptor family protein n=1 Tax=uncultured Massilia sp. TaxID=169973 RepID=UPI002584CE8A|nr:TonB-dependent receptor [uncultured Massilia sp.]
MVQLSLQCKPMALFCGALAGLLGGPAVAADDPETVPVVVVTGSRIEHDSADFPAAIDVVDAWRIGLAQLRVNASEALAAVPGLVVLNRQNYAQDLQISSRGFGARSAFGVRGVRLIADGIPASMPDGQGQAATFNLDMAERIEVLRGPFSALYGNHSGGVVQLFTRDGEGRPTLASTVSGGSDGTRKLDVNAQGESGGIGYVLDASRFDTDGYRDHSAARRDQAFAKLTMRPGAASRLTITASSLTQDDTEDPLGVTWATFRRDPRAGEIDSTDTQLPNRTLAERYNTRKSIDHQQGGAAFEQRFGPDRLRIMAYVGKRKVIQYQAFSRGFQAPPSHSGGVVDFDRDSHGVEIQWIAVREVAGSKLSTTVGLEYGRSRDDRQGFENVVGAQLGVKGALRRDERDTLSNLDPYLQTEWAGGPWVLTAGLRRSSLKVDVEDRYLSNGNDSGAVDYSRITPVLGMLYKVRDALNVYASAARGFETPTLNELFYSNGGGGFNFQLAPARSTHLELGAKLRLGEDTRINAALFQARTEDEMVVDSAAGGRTSYRNASSTLRRGAELSVESLLGGGFSTRAALTLLRATYETGFGNVDAGKRLPGVPRANAYAELAWKDASGRIEAALETMASSKIYVEDTNLEAAAPGYAVVNARLQVRQSVDRWRFKQFLRVNNVFDRRYVGSVIVGDSSRRYYEAAPGRQWMAGDKVEYTF